MKTVRFSEVVKSCGTPDTYLLLIEPAKDKTLQAAIKSNRVMTLFQGSSATKTDYGTVGFEEGSERQFLVFPKTLNSFAGSRVVGIKYDLLESTPISEKDGATQHKPKVKEEKRHPNAKVDQERPKPPKANERTRTEKQPAKHDAKKPLVKQPAKAPSEKLVQFPKPEPSKEVANLGNEIEEIKRRIREAMDMLEQGKQVAAFNLLRRIMEESR